MPEEVFPPAANSPHTTPILIVEDDEGIGQFLQQLIEEETPYQTVVLTNGQSALEQAPALQPCLMLLDYWLPGINGLEVYDRLQEQEKMRGIPVIMMSATLPVEELNKRGIFQLRKPMEIGGVLRMITHALASYEEKQIQKQFH
ncbi:MAG: response regulator [Ktedonobacteraceae bacterium]|nr:response regulator [Ktedonobacteraceae bacterium]MBO0792904.1 response regulator [Ktedonobacteraceae bacterium]